MEQREMKRKQKCGGECDELVGSKTIEDLISNLNILAYYSTLLSFTLPLPLCPHFLF